MTNAHTTFCKSCGGYVAGYVPPGGLSGCNCQSGDTRAGRERVVERAIEAWPGSVRSLAREAGISHTTLSRRPYSEKTAQLVTTALRRVADKLREVAP